MSALFTNTVAHLPPPTPPPPPPSPTDPNSKAQAQMDAATKAAQDRARGQAATMLTDQAGLLSDSTQTGAGSKYGTSYTASVPTASQTLLGS